MRSETNQHEPKRRHAVILAGGDGTRLLPLTSKISGDNRPKQFCRLLGHETLFEQTRKRVQFLIPLEKTAVILTHGHEPYFKHILADTPGRNVVIQPANRGTAPALLYALLRVSREAEEGSVAVFPSDHFVSDSRAFMEHVALGFEAVDLFPEVVVLLGIKPTAPETTYGWIEPGEAFWSTPRGQFYRVSRFWEKPRLESALHLWSHGALWNSFVVIGRVGTLLNLIGQATPELCASFAEIRLGTDHEEESVREVYSALPSIDFSRSVLSAAVQRLAVMPLDGVEWSDIGEPHRVLSALRRSSIRPEWLNQAPDGARERDCRTAVAPYTFGPWRKGQ